MNTLDIQFTENTFLNIIDTENDLYYLDKLKTYIVGICSKYYEEEHENDINYMKVLSAIRIENYYNTIYGKYIENNQICENYVYVLKDWMEIRNDEQNEDYTHNTVIERKYNKFINHFIIRYVINLNENGTEDELLSKRSSINENDNKKLIKRVNPSIKKMKAEFAWEIVKQTMNEVNHKNEINAYVKYISAQLDGKIDNDKDTLNKVFNLLDNTFALKMSPTSNLNPFKPSTIINVVLNAAEKYDNSIQKDSYSHPDNAINRKAEINLLKSLRINGEKIENLKTEFLYKQKKEVKTEPPHK